MAKEVFLLLVPRDEVSFEIEMSSQSGSSFYYGQFRETVGVGSLQVMKTKRTFLKQILEDCGNTVFLEDVVNNFDGTQSIVPI